MSETERKETEPDAASESVRGYDEEAIRRGADNFILRIADAARRQMALGRPLDLPELSRHLKGIETLPSADPAPPISTLDRMRAEAEEVQKARPIYVEQPVNRTGRDPDDVALPVKSFEEPGYSVTKLVKLVQSGKIDGYQLGGSNGGWYAWTKSVNAFKERRLWRDLTRLSLQPRGRGLTQKEQAILRYLDEKYGEFGKGEDPEDPMY